MNITREEFARRMHKSDIIVGKFNFDLDISIDRPFNKLELEDQKGYLDEADVYLKSYEEKDYPKCIVKLEGDKICNGNCLECE